MNLKAPQRSVLRRQHNSCDSRTEQTLPRFFHLSIKHSKRILIDIAGKRAKILLHKVANFTDVSVIGAPTCPPPTPTTQWSLGIQLLEGSATFDKVSGWE